MKNLRIDIGPKQRALVYLNQRPWRYLSTGRHWILRALVPILSRVTIRKLEISELVISLTADELALIPAEDLRVLRLTADQRALVRYRGRPASWLGEGESNVWIAEKSVRPSRDGPNRVEPAVEIEVFDTSQVEAPLLSDDIQLVVPYAEYNEVTVPQGSVALRYVDGVLDSVLEPGRYAAWTTIRKVAFKVLDLREQTIQVQGQEVMTKDRMTLRLNLTAVYRIFDPVRLATVAQEPEEMVYLAMQFAVRKAVTGRTLDQLLANREGMGEEVSGTVAQRASNVGIELLELGLKDVILPGDMKALLNRVLEAQKEAEANVITRREETAATRSLAQTAKVLAENPILIRLKELEAYKDLASNVGEVKVVVGEGLVPNLQIKS